jgi:repressor LexA
MNFGCRLKILRQEKGLTQAQFGAFFNLAESTISLYETGKRTPHYDVLKKFALFFNITIDFLLGHTDERYPQSSIGEKNGIYNLGNSNKPIKLPVVNNILLNKSLIDYEYLTDYQEWISSNIVRDGHYFWLLVKDDRLSGEAILPGDLLLIREQSILDSGELGVIMLDDCDFHILRVYKSANNIILQASNPTYPPVVMSGKECSKVRFLGKAIQLRRVLR